MAYHRDRIEIPGDEVSSPITVLVWATVAGLLLTTGALWLTV
jgi:hypothetical protein